MTATELQEIVSQCRRLVTEESAAARETLSKDFEQHIRAEMAKFQFVGRAEDYGPSFGAQVTASSKFQEFIASRQPGKFRWEVQTKDFTSDTVSIPPQRLGLVGFVNAELRLRSILPAIPVSTGAVTYSRAKDKVVTGSITQLNEGDVKAKASWTYEEETANIITSAEIAKISKQSLDDMPALQAAIDNELISEVMANEEWEILNGPGTKGHMQGFLTVAPTFTGAVANDTPVDIVLRAIGDLENRGYTVSGVVLPVGTALAIALMKDTLGRYLFPRAAFPWSQATISSPKMPAGKFLVGAFRTHSIFLDRSRGVELDLATQHSDDFEKNLCSIRADLRSGLAILRPEGFLQGSLTAPAP